MEQPLKTLGPVPSAPTLAGVPPPAWHLALHRSHSEVHALLSRWNAFLAGFSPEFFLAADGRKIESLVRTKFRRGENTRWFAVNDISAGGEFKVRVNSGILEGPDVSGIGSDPPNISQYMKDIQVEGGEFSVADGHKIWVRITAAATDTDLEYNSEESTDDAAELLTVTTYLKAKTWAATAGEVESGTSLPAGSSTSSCRLLADISITDGTMTIHQRRDGAISVPCITGVYGDDVELAGETVTHEVCIDGNAFTEMFVGKLID